MSLANEPFVALYALIPFILRKEAGATLLQISILASLRPVIPILSFYWSSGLTNSKHRLRRNLIGAWFLGRIPFILIPWFDNSWYIVFCCFMYEVFKKSGNPALIEILKINIEKDLREKIYTLCYVLSFLESIALGFLISFFLSGKFFGWQFLFGFSALIALSSIFVQLKIPLPLVKIEPISERKISLIAPWKEAYHLLRTNQNFLSFQCGFMIGGFGLMLAAPALAVLYVDQLALSSSEIAIGRSIIMGVGVAVSSYFWKSLLSKQDVLSILQKVLALFAIYLFGSYLSIFEIGFFYASCFIYGLAQAGSHLLWNLSGSIFSGEEKDSTQFSRVNILTVALRGIIAPALGSILCKAYGPMPIFVLGGIVCLIGVVFMQVLKSREQKIAELS